MKFIMLSNSSHDQIYHGIKFRIPFNCEIEVVLLLHCCIVTLLHCCCIVALLLHIALYHYVNLSFTIALKTAFLAPTQNCYF